MNQYADISRNIKGNWEGVVKTYFNPNELSDESDIEGSFSLIVDNKFLQHDYKGNLLGKTMHGKEIFGYSSNTNQYQCLWINNSHMGDEMMFLKSDVTTKNNQISVQGSYSAGKEIWGWRIFLNLISKDEIHIKHYNIPPKGEEYVGIDITYNRV